MYLSNLDTTKFDTNLNIEPDLIDFSVGLEAKLITVNLDRTKVSQLSIDTKHQALRNKYFFKVGLLIKFEGTI